MKNLKSFILLLVVILVSGCASPASKNQTSVETAKLIVDGGEINKAYTQADLKTMASSQATFKDVAYVGVSVSSLLQDAGFNLNDVKAVKAIASDGYSVNYDAAQALASDVIVAYARVDGELTQDDGSFRMVIPGAEGKLNVRMLAELQVVK